MFFRVVTGEFPIPGTVVCWELKPETQNLTIELFLFFVSKNLLPGELYIRTNNKLEYRESTTNWYTGNQQQTRIQGTNNELVCGIYVYLRVQ